MRHHEAKHTLMPDGFINSNCSSPCVAVSRRLVPSAVPAPVVRHQNAHMHVSLGVFQRADIRIQWKQTRMEAVVGY